jgi:hypothetical protein
VALTAYLPPRLKSVALFFYSASGPSRVVLWLTLPLTIHEIKVTIKSSHLNKVQVKYIILVAELDADPNSWAVQVEGLQLPTC